MFTGEGVQTSEAEETYYGAGDINSIRGGAVGRLWRSRGSHPLGPLTEVGRDRAMQVDRQTGEGGEGW